MKEIGSLVHTLTVDTTAFLEEFKVSKNRMEQIRRIGQKPEYNPTPEEIAAVCAEIQAGWSEHERRRRGLGGATHEDVDCPMGRINQDAMSEVA